MGIFDKFKSVLGGGSAKPDYTVKSPSRVLREAGIDPSCVNCKIGGDGSVTVSGTVASGAERDKIIALLEEMPNVSGVVNEINIGEPAPEPEPEAAPVEAAAEAEPEAAEGGRTYTVQSGDTLWKISQEMYGNGSKYMKIFEANTNILDNPDLIRPGQKLVIPDLED